MENRRSSFEYEDLLACGRGELFREGPQLPLPPMLMFDRISEIAEAGGEYGKGLMRAVLECEAGPLVFPLSFQGRSGDAGLPRARRAVADGRLLPRLARLLGQRPRARRRRGEARRPGAARHVKEVIYGIDIKRVMRSKLVLGIADGWLKADGEIVYQASDLKVALFKDNAPQPAGA